jgi:hypothetical protein
MSQVIENNIVTLVKSAASSVVTVFINKYLDLVVYFLSSLQQQLSQMIPTDSATIDKYKQAQIMTAAINEIFNDPVFKAQINTFMEQIKKILEPFLNEINLLVAREGDALAVSVKRIGETVTKDAINGVVNAAYGALSSIPGIGTTIDLLAVLQAVVNSTSVIGTEFLNNMTKVMSSILNYYGNTSGTFIDTIRTLKELFDYFGQIQDRVNSRVQQMQNLGKLTARGGRKKKTIRKRRSKGY